MVSILNIRKVFQNKELYKTNNMKQHLHYFQRLLLATVMILNYVVVYADNIEIGGICYSVRYVAKDTYDIAVTNKEGRYSGDIVIPQTINYDGKERQVTSIDYRCFSGCTELTSVKIPDGVTSLKRDCFKDCSSLTSVIIPNSVTSLGEASFYGCSKLESVKLPVGITSLS